MKTGQLVRCVKDHARLTVGAIYKVSRITTTENPIVLTEVIGYFPLDVFESFDVAFSVY